MASLFEVFDPPDPKREKAMEIHRRLCQAYGCPVPYFHSLDPLSELVSSLLSHRTRNKASGAAFRTLRERLTSWEGVRDAPVADVEQAIAPVTWPEQKAPRIQAVLLEITRRRGRLELDFLADLPSADARRWLEQIPGIGPKTSAAVLSFSTLRKRALPVDSHHHRVAVRTALVEPDKAVGPSHHVLEALLPEAFSPQEVYDHHEVMMFHGQRCCFFSNPDCARCPLLDLCPHGQARLGSVRAA